MIDSLQPQRLHLGSASMCLSTRRSPTGSALFRSFHTKCLTLGAQSKLQTFFFPLKPSSAKTSAFPSSSAVKYPDFVHNQMSLYGALVIIGFMAVGAGLVLCSIVLYPTLTSLTLLAQRFAQWVVPLVFLACSGSTMGLSRP